MAILECFDVDNTLLVGHCHFSLARKGLKRFTGNSLIVNGETINPLNRTKEEGINQNYDADLVRQHMKKFLDTPDGLRDRNKIRQHIEKSLNAGNKIAITSFNQYPDALDVMLDKIGLTVDQKKQIHVIAGFPPGGTKDQNGKNYHIQEAMYLTGITDPSQVILTDDSKNNIAAATQLGCHTIEVNKAITEPEYLDRLDQLINEISPNHEQKEAVYQNLEQITKAKKNINRNPTYANFQDIQKQINQKDRNTIKEVPPQVPDRTTSLEAKDFDFSKPLPKTEKLTDKIIEKIAFLVKNIINSSKNRFKTTDKPKSYISDNSQSKTEAVTQARNMRRNLASHRDKNNSTLPPPTGKKVTKNNGMSR